MILLLLLLKQGRSRRFQLCLVSDSQLTRRSGARGAGAARQTRPLDFQKQNRSRPRDARGRNDAVAAGLAALGRRHAPRQLGHGRRAQPGAVSSLDASLMPSGRPDVSHVTRDTRRARRVDASATPEPRPHRRPFLDASETTARRADYEPVTRTCRCAFQTPLCLNQFFLTAAGHGRRHLRKQSAWHVVPFLAARSSFSPSRSRCRCSSISSIGHTTSRGLIFMLVAASSAASAGTTRIARQAAELDQKRSERAHRPHRGRRRRVESGGASDKDD